MADFINSSLSGTEHRNGEIWSSALREIFMTIGRRKTDTLVLEATFGVPPLYYRAGGSVPVTASFGDILGLPVVLLGFAPPDSQAHGPNEFMDLTNFETGIRTIARCWDEMAVALSTDR